MRSMEPVIAAFAVWLVVSIGSADGSQLDVSDLLIGPDGIGESGGPSSLSDTSDSVRASIDS